MGTHRLHRFVAIQCRSGVSLIELLVVIAIFGIIIALTSAGVQRARNAAVRAQCQDNLRQIGLGLHSYHSTAGSLPPGVSSQREKAPQPFMSWQTRLLPYIEQVALWEQTLAAYKQTPNFLNKPPHVGLGIPMSVFSCMADARTRTAHTLPDGTVVALTSYLGVEGTNAFRQDGLLFLDSAIRLTDVTDGTSQTLLVGERPASADLALGWWYAGWGQDKDGEGDMILGVRTKNNMSWAPSCAIGPYDYTPGTLTNQCDAFHFWSMHTNGANFLFADGSVQFLRYEINPIMPALATRAGGEPVSVPD